MRERERGEKWKSVYAPEKDKNEIRTIKVERKRRSRVQVTSRFSLVNKVTNNIIMAYAQQPDDMKAPPPYSSGGMANPGVAYPGQQQYHGEVE